MKTAIDSRKIVRAVQFVLGRKVEPVNIVFVTERRSRELNLKYRRKDKPTNVLSFPETRDVILAPEVIKKEARQYGFSFKEWLVRLAVHGILHLEGYNHRSKSEAQEMERLESRILESGLKSRLFWD